MPSLVSEWMIHGTLYDYVKTFARASFTTCELVRLLFFVSLFFFISFDIYHLTHSFAT